MSSVRRVSEYSSSFLDLKDHMRWEIWGVHRGIGHPSEVINHHAPLTPISTQPTAGRLIQNSKELQTARVHSLEGYLGGKGEQQFLEWL